MEQSNLSIFASELKTKTNMKKILFLLIGLFSLMNANRAVAVVWGILWGFLLVSENITIGKIVGALLIITGIVLFCFSNSEKEDK